MEIFKKLDEDEVKVFQAWAEDNYKPYSPIDGMWHPVVQAECARINDLASRGFVPSTK